MRREIVWRNGWRSIVDAGWAVTVLPSGHEVHAHPDGSTEQARTALSLGYGADVAAMTRDHDPLHAGLCAWLGLPGSFALSDAAGLPAEPELAALEEAAVLAVQRFMRRAGGGLPPG